MSSEGVAKSMTDPYDTLGLDRQADDTAIRRAYARMVRQFPPEREPEAFRRIRAAYEQLRDPERRARLSLFLLQPPPPLPPRRRVAYDLDVHVEDLLTLAMEQVRRLMEQDFCEPERIVRDPRGE